MKNNDYTKFYQERYLEEKIELKSETHLALTCDLETITEVCECIEYITENQTYENERGISGDGYGYDDKIKYSKYYMACKACKYLADYAITLINELREKFEDKNDLNFKIG